MHRRLTQDNCCLHDESGPSLVLESASVRAFGCVRAQAPHCRHVPVAQPLASLLPPRPTNAIKTLSPPTFHHSLLHPPHTHQHTTASTTTPSPSIHINTSHTSNHTHTTANMQIFVKTRTFTPLSRPLPTSRWRRMLTHSQ